MKDINLLPQRIKDARLKKEKIKRKYFYIILILLLFFIIYSIPNFIYENYSDRKKKAELEYNKEKWIEDRLNTLKKLKEEIDNKEQLVLLVKSEGITWSAVLDDIISVLPDGVKLKKIYGDSNTLDIYGYTPDYEKLVTFIEGFKNFRYLTEGNVVYINYNKELNVYEFSINFKMKWQSK